MLRKVLGTSDSLKGQLLRGGLGNGVLKIAYIITQFAIGVILARALSPDGYGKYAYALAVVQLLVVVSQFGFPNYLVKSVAEYRHEKKWGLNRGLLATATAVTLLLSTFIALLLFFDYKSWGLRLSGLDSSLFWPSLLLIPLLALVANYSGVLRGYGLLVKGNVPDQLVRPVSLLCFVGVLVLGESASPGIALWMNVAATSIALLMSGLLVQWHILKPFYGAKIEWDVNNWVRSSSAFLLLAGAQVINHQADMVMLGLMAAERDVGLYRVTVQVVDGLGVVFFAISVAIAPKLAALRAQDEWPKIGKILKASHRIGFALLLAPSVFILYFSRPLLAIVFGADYAAASSSLSILVMGKLSYALFAFSGLALSMIGWANVAAALTGVAVVLNICLNFILIPVYGIEGAAFATAASSVFANVAGAVWLWRKTGMNVSGI
ncbi:flippase [Thauera aminoaromatica]|uniref:flippase n=1 Tax=Thauera aminoaromatica TaxID=164330 RepID=UPI002355D116|nr:flippase [Thauera aminoaromatica]MCK6399190.1 flippase [Thauera aminoaromatica]